MKYFLIHLMRSSCNTRRSTLIKFQTIDDALLNINLG